MPSRRRSMGTSRGRSSATLKPETRTSPLVTGSSAYTSLRTVDLPAPEWPVRNTNSPFAMWNDTSFRASPPLGKDVSFHIARSEEHTSELQSRLHLVCRLLLEKKRKNGGGEKRKTTCKRTD